MEGRHRQWRPAFLTEYGRMIPRCIWLAMRRWHRRSPHAPTRAPDILQELCRFSCPTHVMARGSAAAQNGHRPTTSRWVATPGFRLMGRASYISGASGDHNLRVRMVLFHRANSVAIGQLALTRATRRSGAGAIQRNSAKTVSVSIPLLLTEPAFEMGAILFVAFFVPGLCGCRLSSRAEGNVRPCRFRSRCLPSCLASDIAVSRLPKST